MTHLRATASRARHAAADRRQEKLGGVLPEHPLGFAYNPFTGCVLYVAH